MKTPLALLATFTLFYFASSCKKGDTNNIVPPYDSTHYNDSVKHVTDSIQHIADSIYNTPYGIYYGNTHFMFNDGNGDSDSGDYTDTCSVLKVAADSVFIGFVQGDTAYGHTFLENSEGHYKFLSAASVYDYFEVNVGAGALGVHRHDEDGMGAYDDDLFGGYKKK